MWSLLGTLSKASSKIFMTFVVAIILIIVSILFYPDAYLKLDDFANWLANLDILRNPSDNKQGTAVVRMLLNETTIFGIVVTLVARMIVELLFFATAGMWRLANGSDDEDSAAPEVKTAEPAPTTAATPKEYLES